MTAKRKTAIRREVIAESNHTDHREMPATGDLPEYDNTIERVSDMLTFKAKAAEEAFMNEPVEITIHESTDQNIEPTVFVAVNGEGGGPHKSPWLPRGVPVTVRRKIVERLARAKHVSIRTDEITNSRGERATDIKRYSALKYPFSVNHDPNPKGAAWLKSVLAEV